MAIVIPDQGEVYLLDRMIKGTNASNNLTLKLYTAVTGGLVEGNVIGDFTEASFPGYAAKTLTNASWGGAATNAGTSSSTYGSQQTFTCTGGGGNQACLGYYVVDLTAVKVVWAEAFAATENMVNNGDAINITPKIELA